VLSGNRADSAEATTRLGLFTIRSLFAFRQAVILVRESQEEEEEEEEEDAQRTRLNAARGPDARKKGDIKSKMISVMERLIKKSERYRRRGRVARATLNRVTGNEWTYCNSWPARARAHARATSPSACVIGSRFFYREVERP